MPEETSKKNKTKTQILEAVKGSYGILTLVAKRLGVNRRSVCNYIHRWKDVREAVDEERSRLTDLAEAKLVTLVESGDFKAISFVLEKIGKGNGWGNEQTINLNAEGITPPVIQFVSSGDAQDGADE